MGAILATPPRCSLFNKILKIARTITDLEGKGSEEIGMSHISEAIQYRSLDRGLWR